MGTPDTGNKAPDFSLPADDGQNVTLSHYKKRNLVLYFYPKDDTPGCTKEAIGFTEMADEFAETGTDILGISMDSPAKHEKFKQKHDLSVKLASDPEAKTVADYGSWVEKNMYGRKYMGIDRSTFLIDGDGIIRQVWRKVRVPGHVEAVLQAAREL